MRNVILAVLAFVAISACNTVEGIGQDVKKAGNAIENAATR